MRTQLAAAVGLILVASILRGQSVPHVDAGPRPFTGTWGNATSAFPFARSGGLVQYWWRWDNLRFFQQVTAIGARPAKTVVAPVVTLTRVEVKLSSTSIGPTAFGKNLASNFGAQVTTVFAAKPVSLPAIAPPYDPNTATIWLNADNPFVHVGQNLVCQFDLGSAVGAVDLAHFSDACSMSGATSTLNMTSTVSCGSGQLAATSPDSSNYALRLVGAPPLTPVAFMLGTDHTRFSGVPLPFKLEIIGMPGCLLGVDPLITVNVPSDATGAASMTMPIALAEPDVFFAQAVHSDPTKPLGLASTNVAHSILGGDGIYDQAYNLTADGPSAQHGPFHANVGAVILIK